uniref:Phospholipase A1 n=1 Tax=Tetrahymena thermophila TaxID=5911 RepID=Q8IEV8_TETTH|nr:phospholipase A1 [Tetrahymena thermophila]
MNKTLILALVVVLALTATTLVAFHNHSHNIRVDQDPATLFKQFKQTYNKKYADATFETYRFGVFTQNLEIVKTDSTFGVTQFMDLTPAEFAQQFLTLHEKVNSTEVYRAQGEATEVDWTAKGKVTPVKNQGSCGSCWAFSTIGAVESALWIAGQGEQNTLNLAEQEQVDCAKSPKYDSEGCNGGWMVEGFKYIIDNKISQTANYPYTAKDGKCKDTSSFKKFSISKYAEIPQGDCNSLNSALEQGPISVAVDATNFQFYTSGVFKNCKANLNHGVLLVANVDSSLKIKNSWGPSWGEKGFIRLAAGNTCGVCNAASYPIV